MKNICRHKKDEYNRYAHTNSLAYKENFLQTPIINIWMQELKKSLQQKFPQIIFQKEFFPVYSNL